VHVHVEGFYAYKVYKFQGAELLGFSWFLSISIHLDSRESPSLRISCVYNNIFAYIYFSGTRTGLMKHGAEVCWEGFLLIHIFCSRTASVAAAP
jgi:hypothetical protein